MSYFGTDGIRNKAVFFDKRFLTLVGLGISQLPSCQCVAIGRDTRPSGVYIEAILVDVLSSHGVEVIKTGVLPSPSLAVCGTYLKCDYSIMLSASHNPPDYNGIKIFDRTGKKLSQKYENEIEKYLANPYAVPLSPAKTYFIDGKQIYCDFIKSVLNINLERSRILLDCAYGAASHFAKDIFCMCNADVTSIYDAYCGERINDFCGATNPSTIESVMSDSFNLGFAFDGDADRVIASCENKIFDGDHIMYVNALALKKENKLRFNTVVGTIMSNSGVENAYKRANINFLRAPVGDRNVFEIMEKNGYCLGGEASGHIIFGHYLNTGDGILTALITAQLNVTKSIFLLDDIIELPSFSDFVLTDKRGIQKFNSDRRFLSVAPHDASIRTVIRASGTEPKIRISVEGKNVTKTQNALKKIKAAIEELLNEDI